MEKKYVLSLTITEVVFKFDKSLPSPFISKRLISTEAVFVYK